MYIKYLYLWTLFTLGETWDFRPFFFFLSLMVAAGFSELQPEPAAPELDFSAMESEGPVDGLNAGTAFTLEPFFCVNNFKKE